MNLKYFIFLSMLMSACSNPQLQKQNPVGKLRAFNNCRMNSQIPPCHTGRALSGAG